MVCRSGRERSLYDGIALFIKEVKFSMRCLYCGIRLKIAKRAKMIEHCPECSVRIEHEGRQESGLLRAEDKNRGARAVGVRPLAAFVAMKSA